MCRDVVVLRSYPSSGSCAETEDLIAVDRQRIDERPPSGRIKVGLGLDSQVAAKCSNATWPSQFRGVA